ncbi:MAG TPA: hypothetical protein VFK32_07355, partial [Tepidiformaceae bacterium]|nr:hypothetical protein [Tepidiformaceae bacterium]
MLGEKIGELAGKVTVQRVLPGDDYRYVKMEVTIEQQGKILGIDASDLGTFTAYERSGGQIYAQGQGIIMATDGSSAIWNGHGVAHPTGDGLGLSIRFSIAFQAGEGPLARLNDVLVIGEFEQSGDGAVKTTIWEWK